MWISNYDCYQKISLEREREREREREQELELELEREQEQMSPQIKTIVSTVLKAEQVTEQLQAHRHSLKACIDKAIEDFNLRTGLRVTHIECSYESNGTGTLNSIPFLTIWYK